MKKLVSLLLAVCMCLSVGVMLTACGDEEHTHTYKTEWAKDATYHWHACEDENCTDVADKAEHVWDEGAITKEATAEADGVKTFTCTVCGETKTEVVEYVAQAVDKSGYSIFYSDTSDDAIYLIEHNEAGLPVAVYYDDAFYGERVGERQLEYSIEYTNDELISSIVSPYYYYEIEYNEDCTYAYGVAYQTNTVKKIENGRTIVISYTENKQLKTISAYGVRGSLAQYIFNEDGHVVRLLDDDEVNLFEYDELGRFVSCTNMDMSDSSATGTITFSYDGEAELPNAYTYTIDGVVGIKGTNITYDDAGQILTATLTYYEDEAADYIFENTSSFDENGKLVSYYLREGDAEEFATSDVLYTELKYNDEGLLIEEVESEGNGNNKKDTYKKQYEYDANGNCICETYSYYAEDGITVESTSSTTYTYDANNLCTSKIRGNGEGTRYTYDTNGLLVSEIYVFEDGTESDPITHQWIFDDNGRLLERSGQRFTYGEDGKKMSYFDVENDYGAGNSYAFTYDASGRVIKINIVVKESRWDAVLQDIVVDISRTGTSTYTYAESGELVTASLYEWGYDVGEYVNNTYDYTTIE